MNGALPKSYHPHFITLTNYSIQEFPVAELDKDLPALAWVQAMTWKLPHAAGAAKKLHKTKGNYTLYKLSTIAKKFTISIELYSLKSGFTRYMNEQR